MTSPKYQPVDSLEETALEKKMELDNVEDGLDRGPVKSSTVSIFSPPK
jgi:hypothetical protein